MERVHLAIGSAGAEDWAFHTSIYQASGNPLLLQMLNGIYDSMHAFFESPLSRPCLLILSAYIVIFSMLYVSATAFLHAKFAIKFSILLNAI